MIGNSHHAEQSGDQVLIRSDGRAVRISFQFNLNSELLLYRFLSWNITLHLGIAKDDALGPGEVSRASQRM